MWCICMQTHSKPQITKSTCQMSQSIHHAPLFLDRHCSVLPFHLQLRYLSDSTHHIRSVSNTMLYLAIVYVVALRISTYCGHFSYILKPVITAHPSRYSRSLKSPPYHLHPREAYEAGYISIKGDPIHGTAKPVGVFQRTASFYFHKESSRQGSMLPYLPLCQIC
ncbi:hypothetical protein F5Y15DRAFT_326228 [Xylariaceae sp. FL0016]|nr:hypothetical protein F5Y15DRAFT_326228 [Xylariaceae sp. FL0016]